MRTERTFLMELFLDDDLPKPIKIKIKERFEELERPQMEGRPYGDVPVFNGVEFNEKGNIVSNQSPSMQRLMQANPDLIPKAPIPVTPAAAQALAARNALMQSAGSEKPENGRKAPRKA